MQNSSVPYEMSANKLGNAFKEAPNIFPYQKSQSDDRWIVKRSEVKTFEELMLSFKRIHLGSNHDHPAILFIRKCYVQTKKTHKEAVTYEVYEKMPRMKQDLQTILQAHIAEKNFMTQKDILPIAYDIICALDYLHNKKIPHRNIKLTNILFNHDGKAKLADISISKGSNPNYIAPEIQNENNITNKRAFEKADMWSLGVVLAELCFNRTGVIGLPDLKERIQDLSERFEDKFVRFIESLLETDSQQRISSQNAKKYFEKHFFDICNYYVPRQSMLVKRDNELKREIENKHQEIYQFVKNDISSINISTINGIKSNNDTISRLFEDLQDLRNDFKDTSSFEFDANSSYLIDHNATRTISQYIEGYLHELFYLNLNFKYSEKIDDEAIKQLCQPASHLEKLQELSLNFRWCKKITNNGLHKLTSHIASQWKTLRFLTLDFGNCPGIDSDGIQRMSINMQGKIPELERLKLVFSGCKSIDDRGIKSLCDLIGPSLPKLQDLSFYFAECSEISVKAFKEFCKSLKQKRNMINNVKLDFTGCNNLIDGLGLKDIKKIRDELTFLQSFDLEFF